MTDRCEINGNTLAIILTARGYEREAAWVGARGFDKITHDGQECGISDVTYSDAHIEREAKKLTKALAARADSDQARTIVSVSDSFLAFCKEVSNRYAYANPRGEDLSYLSHSLVGGLFWPDK